MMEHQDRLHYLYHQFIHNLATPEELEEFWKAMDELKEDDAVKDTIFQQYGEKLPAAMQQYSPDWNASLKKIMDAPKENSITVIKPLQRKWYWAAAVVIIILCGSAAFFILN